ncbi:hypothetical protein K461DRAFT_225848 [Myriangium duriaei CBS 260.36]|uniref:DUF1330 domain-containing protein n=1 Tax=Myriangium duriaei CBS 260.36 TaxID=1168546 RepID=A0A9P4J160_9PEZI|nr:hypothetical protein K461DRAFT_225848 [Myriangium duriaei CBS 260.36]
MPLCSLYLLSLDGSTSLRGFVDSIRNSYGPSNQPLVVGRVVRWIIVPWLDRATSPESKALDNLTSTKWDLLVILPGVVAMPQALSEHVRKTFKAQVGIPSGLVTNFVSTTNPSLLQPKPGATPPLESGSRRTATSTKDLELTPDLLDWIEGQSSSQPKVPRGAVSMLNLLSFPSDPSAKASYQKYGQAFGQRVGARHGGNAKLVGNIVQPANGAWDEFALAHYPTINHFAAMVGSDEYQQVNTQYRKDSLRGTAILCCDELDDEVFSGSSSDGTGPSSAKL